MVKHLIFQIIFFNLNDSLGLISYAEPGILLAKDSSDAKKRNVVELISHEYAHQFFGNIVSPKWWSYLWMNEAFATLMSTFIPSQIYSDDEYMNRFYLNQQKSAFRYDVGDAKPLNFYVESVKDIENKFDTISYSKGASVLRMFQEAMGEDVFAKGLGYYLKEMSNKAADPSDLHRNLQKAVDETTLKMNIEKYMSTWENQMGYPTITVKLLDGKFSLTQARIESSSEIYSIPITYVTSSMTTVDRKPKIWMTEKTLDISRGSSDDWIVLNLHRDGYYKVKYSKDIQTAQVNGLKEHYSKFPLMNRIQFFEDFNETLNLKEIAEESNGIKLLQNIANEKDELVYQRIIPLEKYFSRRFVGREHSEKYRALIMDAVKPHLTRLGYDTKTDDTEKDKILRSNITNISCRLLDENCLTKKYEMLTTNAESVEVSELCSAFRKMKNESFDTFAALKIPDTFTSKFLPFFSCSLDNAFLTRTMKLIIDEPKVPKSDVKEILKNGLMSDAGLIKILDLLAENIEKLNTL